jgi:sulfur-carrier protein adenylyltransferase/sulfurtransferase
MPKVAAQLREEGISRVDAFLLAKCGALRLSGDDIRSYKLRSLITGWQVRIETPVTIRRLDIGIDQEFPFSLPYFFLVDRPPFLTWPHIEEDGHLCLLDDTVVAKFNQPESVIGDTLRDAFRLILDCEAGANQNDFRTEFYSYWNRRLSTSSEIIQSLLEPHGESRLVHVWRGEVRSVVGETESAILQWLRRKYGDQPQFKSTDRALLLWLGQPFLPGEYPESGADLYRLACEAKGGRDQLDLLAKIDNSPFYFIIGTDCTNGPCFAGVRTARPAASDIRGRKRDHSGDGFRTGKVPQALLTQRLFSVSAPASRLQVERVDAGWIHGRDYDPRQKKLSSKRVIVAGCGSVGAPIAQMVAMAGVGRLQLVDGEELSWANVGRHVLGAESAGKNKAKALADRLQKSYPHSQIDGFEMTLEEFTEAHPDFVGQSDLIVSATADWKSENILNLKEVCGEMTQPMIYVWTEPHACAGHAVYVLPGGPCFRCGFDASGRPKLELTVWPSEKRQRREPACGAVFQPYGPLELLGTISAGASLVLDSLLGKLLSATHRIWAGPQTLLIEAGGTWSEEWLRTHRDCVEGGFQEQQNWLGDSDCPVCGITSIKAHSPIPSGNQDNASLSVLQS